jgi:hypothetical protein
MTDTGYKFAINKREEKNENEKNDNPRDSTFRFLQEYHSEAQHISLRFPGIFVKTLPTDVFTINNRSFRMDGAELVLPDDTLPCKSVLNPEQQTKALTPEKVHVLYDYKLQLTFNHKLPSLNVVVTNIGDKDHTVIYESHGDAFKIYIRVFNDKEISQRLSTVSKIIYNNQYLSQELALNLGVIGLYAPREHACEIMETVVDLYIHIVADLDLAMEYTLYSVITILLDAFFDDENEYGRLTKMIDEKTSKESKMHFASHESTIKSLAYAEEDLARTEDDLAHAKDDLARTEDDLAHAKDDLARTKDDLAKANGKIADLEEEVKRLTNELNGK